MVSAMATVSGARVFSAGDTTYDMRYIPQRSRLGFGCVYMRFALCAVRVADGFEEFG